MKHPFIELKFICMLCILCIIFTSLYSLNINSGRSKELNDNPENGKYIGNLDNDVIVITLDNITIDKKDRGTFSIVSIYADNVWQANRTIIQYAVDEWDYLIQTTVNAPYLYAISFQFAPLGPTTLGLTRTYVDGETGDLLYAEITFNTGFIWFIDPSPSEDSDVASSPANSYDLLTVARHEIAHAVGWISIGDHITDLMHDDIFDPSRMNIATTYPNQMHVNRSHHPNDLMLPNIGTRSRRPISIYPDLSLIARAFDYGVRTRYVDKDASLLFIGTANWPFKTVQHAFESTPSGIPIVIIPGTYIEDVPIERTLSTMLIKARGGDVIIKGP